MKCLFVVNKTAGKNNKEKMMEEIHKFMEEIHQEYKILTKDLRWENWDALFYEVDHIISVGGDGTNHYCINAAMERNIPKFSILPAGSGNDFSRTLEASREVREQLEKIFSGKSRKIDVGKWNDQYFLNIASIGFDADVNYITNREVLKKYGTFGFIISLMKKALQYEAKTIVFPWKGERKEKEIAVFTLGNGKYYGGGVPIFHSSSVEDGKLELLIVERKEMRRLPLLIGSLYLKKDHLWKRGFYRDKIETFSMEIKNEAIVNLDGESHFYKGPVKVEIIKNAIEYKG
ncbi:YegS/Rv2252/BmrU family lipid kinase [Peptoniphilus sp. KCTC 25270]|uniref:diacylglycerol/lipid kinase family protein n=1 Tax=Peptoniphilus sp. KCTC 25270 TaxID=2897414 RepID=UPI001E56F973|nr:YegS/Rv2252/BmrU family lipid kinase [Peptoniphilus sp. KCTC 25270]MCD1147825.1 YegS/Rv2252/BmrU family lipid kinase [Peptoniphilus sp. KCTC 25270]